jgi:hypothetical protein
MVQRRMSELLHEKKSGRLQWLQDLSQINGNNVNSVRHETSRHFMNKKEYVKHKMNLQYTAQRTLETYIEE